ncbi:MAG: phytoene/squalene synthase family protein [Deltaproteobacteria bacterium]|nr:phytoene/squalene synthase family protein [Deltaproteobacteria bacterium]
MKRLDPAIVAESRRVMADHARSFDRAARFLPARLRDPVAVLYAFCRMVDDTVDRASFPEVAHAELARIRAELRGETAARPIIAGVRALLTEPLHLAAAEALVAGVEGDIGPVAIADSDALVRYAYMVAGSVGVLMCAVFDVRDPAALPFAIDLGVAMQLTNICRDVKEDAALGRVYLPADALARRGVTPEMLVSDLAPRGPVAAVVLEVLALADRYYASAELGMRYLPDAARPAILVASRLYQAIGTTLRRWGGDALRGRAFVSRADKAWHIVRALTAALGHVTPRAVPAHDPGLHRGLGGCPGANV